MSTSDHGNIGDISPCKQGNDWAVRMSDSVLLRNSELNDIWSYEYGVIWKGMELTWRKTKERKYFDYIKRNMDSYIDSFGNIRGYSNSKNIDHINNGKTLLFLFKTTRQEKYKKAACILREQLHTHPRTTEGSFWHKAVYPHQVWLDGLYMALPFYCEYAMLFDELEVFADISKQLGLIELHARDAKTGLLYHGWDESRQEKWANPLTGCSENFWGRAMGWYLMALVDVLDYFPINHNDCENIINILNRAVEAIEKVQDKESGLWYQVLDQGNRRGNYHEASASCMFVYALAKAVRKGYIEEKYLDIARHGFEGIIRDCIEADENGLLNLKNTCRVAGLGGESKPYRDGSYEYYIHEPTKLNDHKGIGAFLLAACEIR